MTQLRNIPTKAYVVDAKGAPFMLRDVILDEVREHEVLVEIKYTGICHTDIVVKQGGMPIGGYPCVLGHEGVGIVRAVGTGVSDKSLVPGDTVLLSYHSCQQCKACVSGRCGACPHMTETNFINTARGPAEKSPISLPSGETVHGQFFGQSSLSKMSVVTEKSIVKIEASPEDLAYLAPLSCGYQTGAGTMFNVLKPLADDKVAILGMGAVGLAAVMAAKAMGVRQIVVVDIVDAKLEKAHTLGATYTINAKSVQDVNVGIREIFPEGVDKIMDATGVASLLEPAVKALAHEGTLALVGVPPPTAQLCINALEFMLSCKRIVGVIEGQSDPQQLIPELITLYKSGRFPIDQIATVYPAEDLDQAISDLQSGQVIKPILSWETI